MNAEIERREKEVLILPMRNGNTNQYNQNLLYPIFRSYPTYEEWKPFKKSSISSILVRSYPTYEEWKLGNIS